MGRKKGAKNFQDSGDVLSRFADAGWVKDAAVVGTKTRRLRGQVSEIVVEVLSDDVLLPATFEGVRVTIVKRAVIKPDEEELKNIREEKMRRGETRASR